MDGHRRPIPGARQLDVDEREILDVAVALIVIRMSDVGMAIALRKQGIALLEQYLANGRQKAIEQELRARLVLAETYLPEKRGEASRVLTAEQAAPPMPTATAAMEYGALVRLRDRLRRSGATAASPAP
jgi:hypothetical protein